MKALMMWLKLQVNETRTRLACITESQHHLPAICSAGSTEGTDDPRLEPGKPSRACSNGSTIERRHDGTRTTPENAVTVLSRLLRGWCGYLDQGPVMDTYNLIREYVDRRLRYCW